MRDRAENKITIVMIRHGATESNREHRYLGRREEALSAEGRKELLQYRERNRYPEVDCLFVSPMKRCVQTAQLLYPDIEPVCVAAWTEMDFGAFEGKNYRELQGDVRYQEWIDSGGRLPFPEGENREHFVARCESGFLEMMRWVEESMGEKRGGTVGMVVHGGTIMALLSRYGGGEYFDYQTENGKGYVCTCGRERGLFHFEQIRELM